MAEILGPELLANGDFEASTGTGAASSIGPGWTTGYAPCGPSLFGAPCGGGNYSFFTTNAGQATGNNPAATPIPAIGSRSMAVNVSGNVNVPIISWLNVPLVNGQTYRLSAAAAIIFGPFAVAVRINNGVDGIFPVAAPSMAATWQTTVTDFVYTGPTGNQTVSLNSNSGVLGGNDHTFDQFSLRSVTVDNSVLPCDCCPVVDSICALVAHQFTAVIETVAAPGWGQTNLPLTIDGNVGGQVNGYNSPAGNPPPGSTPTVRYSVDSLNQQNVAGVRLWNQGGGNLSDFDGLGPTTTVTFLDAALVPLFSTTLNAANGGAPTTTLLPSQLDGVAFVELSTLGKLTAGSVAPLWREFQILNIEPLFPCRRPNGALEWYTSEGVLIPQPVTAVPCPAS
jgi:hypothetical protein